MEASDKLAIGICNGCQALVKSDLWQHPDQRQSVTLTANDHGTYVCRWVEVERGEGGDAWFSQTPQHFALPIAHGEGRFMANDALTPALTYIGDNPNGSQQNCAALTGYDGRALVMMMPHPERAVRFTQQPDWTSVREVDVVAMVKKRPFMGQARRFLPQPPIGLLVKVHAHIPRQKLAFKRSPSLTSDV